MRQILGASGRRRTQADGVSHASADQKLVQGPDETTSAGCRIFSSGQAALARGDASGIRAPTYADSPGTGCWWVISSNGQAKPPAGFVFQHLARDSARWGFVGLVA